MGLINHEPMTEAFPAKVTKKETLKAQRETDPPLLALQVEQGPPASRSQNGPSDSPLGKGHLRPPHTGH